MPHKQRLLWVLIQMQMTVTLTVKTTDRENIKRTYKHSKQTPDRVLLTHSRAQEGPSGASY